MYREGVFLMKIKGGSCCAFELNQVNILYGLLLKRFGERYLTPTLSLYNMLYITETLYTHPKRC